MGLDTPSRWYVEMVTHWGHPVTQTDLDHYGIPDKDTIPELHKAFGCIKEKPAQVAFWRERVKEEKADGDSTTLRHAAQTLAKYMRGHYK